MSAIAAPFGLKAIAPSRGGVAPRQFAMKGGILNTEAVRISIGDPVVLTANGTIARATAGAITLFGVFNGCDYRLASDFFIGHKVWPGALPGATDIVAYIYRDPDIEYVIQANGAIPATAVGDCADFAAITDGNSFGFSLVALGTMVGATANFRVTGLYPEPGNAWGDAYTKVTGILHEVAGFAGAPV